MSMTMPVVVVVAAVAVVYYDNHKTIMMRMMMKMISLFFRCWYYLCVYVCPGIQVDDGRIILMLSFRFVSFRFVRLGFGKVREDDEVNCI